MVKKFWFGLLVAALMLSLGTATVFAIEGDEDTEGPVCPMINDEDEEYGTASYFCDGRLNAFDIMQPVAIYYDTDFVVSWDADEEMVITTVINGLEVWAVDSLGVGQLALYVSGAELAAAMAATGDHVVASSGVISLHCSPASKMFWVVAPGYTFEWAF